MNAAPAPADASDRLNLLGLDRKAMAAFCVEQGEKPFRASQLLQWIHQRGIGDFGEMTNLSKVLRARLEDRCEIRPPEIVHEQVSADGTCKWVLQTDAQNRIETVFIPEEGRGTLCVSSQVGCALECSFCSTARQGFNRNLSTAEIIGQLWVAQRELGIGAVTNVVLMGMGYRVGHSGGELVYTHKAGAAYTASAEATDAAGARAPMTERGRASDDR